MRTGEEQVAAPAKYICINCIKQDEHEDAKAFARLQKLGYFCVIRNGGPVWGEA